MGARDAAFWHELAATVEPRTNAFVDGGFVPAASGPRSPSINPATGTVLAMVAACDAEDVGRAVAAARRAFAGGRWSAAAPAHRKGVLLRLAELIREHADELALLDSLDAGKLITDTAAIDVPGSAAILQWYAETIDKRYGEIAPTDRGDLALVSREPLGVVAAVVPWNYPLEMAIWKIAPALAAGNSVVLKPAEESPLSVLRLAELSAEAGLPDGVLNVVPGEGPVAGQALGVHPDVDAVTFTGSTPVGKLFLTYAGQSNMKQVEARRRNAIPARTEGRWYVRAESLAQLAGTEEKVWRCFRAGALATGCELDITPESKPYAEFRTHEPALRAYVRNAERLGRTFDPELPGPPHEPGVHRHGQRLAAGAGDPPLRGRQLAAGTQPPAGVRRSLRRSGRREGAARRRDRARLDGPRRRRRPRHTLTTRHPTFRRRRGFSRRRVRG
jgi:hypothetical protein